MKHNHAKLYKKIKERDKEECTNVYPCLAVHPWFASNIISNEKSLKIRSLSLFWPFIQHVFNKIKEPDNTEIETQLNNVYLNLPSSDVYKPRSPIADILKIFTRFWMFTYSNPKIRSKPLFYDSLHSTLQVPCLSSWFDLTKHKLPTSCLETFT